MKIAKIIRIMKFFTSSLFFVKSGGNPAFRVIMPTLWGASPHGLGKNWAPQARAARVGGPFRHAGARQQLGANTLIAIAINSRHPKMLFTSVSRRVMPVKAGGDRRIDSDKELLVPVD